MNQSRLDEPRRTALSVGFAILSVTLATALTYFIQNVTPHSRALWLVVAVMFSASFGGQLGGIVASVLAVLSFDYFFDSHPYAIDLNVPGLIRTVAFLAAAMIVTYLTTQRKRATEAALASNEKLQQALDEITLLRGMIPICMHCKQIRNDAGIWQEVERYIAKHSDARFTHGICPDCMRKHYPDVAAKRAAASAARPAPSQSPETLEN